MGIVHVVDILHFGTDAAVGIIQHDLITVCVSLALNGLDTAAEKRVCNIGYLYADGIGAVGF